MDKELAVDLGSKVLLIVAEARKGDGFGLHDVVAGNDEVFDKQYEEREFMAHVGEQFASIIGKREDVAVATEEAKMADAGEEAAEEMEAEAVAHAKDERIFAIDADKIERFCAQVLLQEKEEYVLENFVESLQQMLEFVLDEDTQRVLAERGSKKSASENLFEG